MRSLCLCLISAALLLSAPSRLLAEFRSYNGWGNNADHPTWGQADVQLLRLCDPNYADDMTAPRGGWDSTLPSTRLVSNTIAAQTSPIPNTYNTSSWLFQWGQFLDHDIDLTEPHHPTEAFDIPVPAGDLWFDPNGTGTKTIALNRSIYDPTTGDAPNNPREQINQITSYIDASAIYGSTQARADALRTGSGGRLKTSANNLLPYNTMGLANASMGDPSKDFVSGDPRANEQIGLTAVHTLFMREHNRLADDIQARLNAGEQALVDKFNASGLDEDQFIFQSARKVVGAQMQKITYEEFLPLLIGRLDDYAGYRDTINAGIYNEFSGAAYRVGHTMLPGHLLRRNDDGTIADEGDLELRHAFFSPDQITEHGIDSLLKGLSVSRTQQIDRHVIDDVRNFLFGPPGSGGFDLAALNMQRGRDQGLPGINDARADLGLERYETFLELACGDADLAAAFALVYDTVDDVDLWIGGISEKHIAGAMVGETFHAIITRQFEDLRDGDSFWYELEAIYNHVLLLDPTFDALRLSDVVMRNTELTGLQDNVFLIPEPASLAMVLAGGATLAIRRRRR